MERGTANVAMFIRLFLSLFLLYSSRFNMRYNDAICSSVICPLKEGNKLGHILNCLLYIFSASFFVVVVELITWMIAGRRQENLPKSYETATINQGARRNAKPKSFRVIPWCIYIYQSSILYCIHVVAVASI